MGRSRVRRGGSRGRGEGVGLGEEGVWAGRGILA